MASGFMDTNPAIREQSVKVSYAHKLQIFFHYQIRCFFVKRSAQEDRVKCICFTYVYTFYVCIVNQLRLFSNHTELQQKWMETAK